MHGTENDDRPRLAWGNFLPGQARPAIQLGPGNDGIGITVALNASDDFEKPMPDVTDSVGKFGRSDNNIGPGLDAELRKLPGGRLAMIALRRPVA